MAVKIGDKIYKNNQEQMAKYTDIANECTKKGWLIIDKKTYFEIIDNKPTEKDKQAMIQAQLTAVVQAWMDKTVQKRNYDNIHTACTYAYSTDEIFKKEGTACLEWRDTVWRTCYNILNDVLAGRREIPTEEELIAELPVLEW